MVRTCNSLGGKVCRLAMAFVFLWQTADPGSAPALAPQSRCKILAVTLHQAAVIKTAMDAGNYLRFHLDNKIDSQPDMGSGMKQALGDAIKTALIKKWKETLKVLLLHYAEAKPKLISSAHVFLVGSAEDAEGSLHPHTLAMGSEDRDWDVRMIHVERPNGEAVRIYMPLGLFMDRRCTPDALADLLHQAAVGDEKEGPFPRVFRTMIEEDKDRIKICQAMKVSARYDAIARTPQQIQRYRAMNRAFPDSVWKTEETAIAAVRMKIKDERPELWQEYLGVKQLLADGAIRLSDFPGALIALQKKLYDITYKEFASSEGLGLWAPGHMDIAPYFPSYGVALMKSFPELDLNPVVFGDTGAWKNKTDAIAAIQYRFGTSADPRYAEIWRKYASIRDKLRSGEIALGHFPQEVLALRDAVIKIRRGDFEKIPSLKTLIDNPEPFGGSHIQALIEAFPDIGLVFPSFDQYQGKWSNPGEAAIEVASRIAKAQPDVWRETLAVRDAIRRGDLDPSDYPERVIRMMNAFYNYSWEMYVKADHMDLRPILEEGQTPYWEGHRSQMFKHILPEFPWTSIGFRERHAWQSNSEAGKELRYRVAKFDLEQRPVPALSDKTPIPGLFQEIRSLERKISARQIDVNDFSPEYVAVVERILKTLDSAWIYKHVSSNIFVEGPRGTSRSLADALNLAFPLLRLNPAAMMIPSSWQNPKHAPREVRYRLARTVPSLWKVYRTIAKRKKAGVLPAGKYPPELIYAVERMHKELKPKFLTDAKKGLALEGALKKGRPSMFSGDSFKLVSESFSEIPWFIELYTQGRQKGDAAQSEAYAQYQKAKEKGLGAKAVEWTEDEFYSYLEKMDGKEETKKQAPAATKVAIASQITSRDLDLLRGFIKAMPVLLSRHSGNYAAAFLDHFDRERHRTPKVLPGVLSALLKLDENTFKRLLSDVFALGPYRSLPFRYMFHAMPNAQALMSLAPHDEKIRRTLHRWITEKPGSDGLQEIPPANTPVTTSALAPGSLAQSVFIRWADLIFPINRALAELYFRKPLYPDKARRFRIKLALAGRRLEARSGIKFRMDLVRKTDRGLMIPFEFEGRVGVYLATGRLRSMADFREFSLRDSKMLNISVIAGRTGWVPKSVSSTTSAAGLSPETLQNRIREMIRLRQFTPESARLIAGKEPYLLHHLFHKNMIDDLKIPPAVAYRIHSGLRDNVFRDGRSVYRALDILSEKDWKTKIENGGVGVIIALINDAFSSEVRPQTQDRLIQQWLVNQGIRQEFAEGLMAKEGAQPFASEELDLLAMITLAAQRAISAGKRGAVLWLPSEDDVDEALGLLTDTAQEHPDEDNPFLLNLHKGRARVTPLWIENAPFVTLAVAKGPPIKYREGLSMEELVQRIREVDPRHSVPMALEIAQRMKEMDLEYSKVWKAVYLEKLGLDPGRAKKIGSFIRGELLLNAEKNARLSKVLKWFPTPFLFEPLLGSESSHRLLRDLEFFIEGGVWPNTARELVLAEEEKSYTQEEINLLLRCTLAAQKSLQKGKNDLALGFDSDPELQEASAQFQKIVRVYSTLGEFDEGRRILDMRWMRYTRGAAPEAKVLLALAGSGNDFVAGQVLLMQKQEDQIRKRLRSARYQAALGQKLRRTEELIREKRHLFIYDSYGKPVAWWEENLARDFDEALEVLLREHGAVWVEGIVLTEQGHMSVESSIHFSHPDILRRGEKFKMKRPGRVAVYLKKGFGNRTLEMCYARPDALKKLREKADGKSEWTKSLQTAGRGKTHYRTATIGVLADQGPQPLDTVSAEQAEGLKAIWDWLSASGGRPVVVDHMETTSIGVFPFLLSKGIGRRTGLDKNERVRLQISPKTNGVEFRLTYLEAAKSPTPRTYVLNVRIPRGIISKILFFRNAADRLLESADGLNGGEVFWETSNELARIKKSLIASERTTAADWDEAAKGVLEEKLEDLRAKFGGSLNKALESGTLPKGLLILYGADGKAADFFEGSIMHKKIPEKMQDQVNQGRHVFWIAGIRLTAENIMLNFPGAHSVSFKRLQWPPNQLLAVCMEQGQDGKLRPVGAKTLEEFEKQLSTGTPSADLAIVEIAGGKVEVRPVASQGNRSGDLPQGVTHPTASSALAPPWTLWRKPKGIHRT